MKRFISFLALVTMLCTTASAQNNAYRSVVGLYNDATGTMAVADPSTTIVVDVTVEKEQTVVGPYARYAQKYLDVRGSLVEKTTYTVVDAQLAIMTCEAVLSPSEVAPASVAVQSHLNPEAEFAKVLPDRMSLSPMSVEDAAAQAAQAIFTLRKKRVDLITGDAGENVFGGGLKDALDALDAREQMLLELFLGKKITTRTTKRFIVPLNGTTASYTIAKISASMGLQSATAPDGDDVKLNLNPSGTTPQFEAMQEADPRDKTAINVRLADNVTCTVTAGGGVVGEATLPVFEFGRTARVTNTLAAKR